MNKAKMIVELIDHVKTLLERAEKEQKDAQHEANQHVGAMASRYDTFKEEAQYLSGAHKARTFQLNSELQSLLELQEKFKKGLDASRSVTIATMITLQDLDGNVSNYFLAPGGGGYKFDLSNEICVVITPSSPLGKQVMNKEIGDEVEIRKGGKVKTMEILIIK